MRPNTRSCLNFSFTERSADTIKVCVLNLNWRKQCKIHEIFSSILVPISNFKTGNFYFAIPDWPEKIKTGLHSFLKIIDKKNVAFLKQKTEGFVSLTIGQRQKTIAHRILNTLSDTVWPQNGTYRINLYYFVVMQGSSGHSK